MDLFLDNAREILDTAANTAGADAGGVDILVGPRGDLQMLDGSGWALDRLRVERGAAMAYRVTRRRGLVRVEGRTALRSCTLECETPAAVARRILGGRLPARPHAYALAAPVAR